MVASDVGAAFNVDGETTPVASRIMSASVVGRASKISRIAYNRAKAIDRLENHQA